MQIAADTEMSPRKPVTSAPYAFKSVTADLAAQADNATTLEGNSAAQLDQSKVPMFLIRLTPTLLNALHHSKYEDRDAITAMQMS